VEILEELGSGHEVDSDADSTWSAKWGSSSKHFEGVPICEVGKTFTGPSLEYKARLAIVFVAETRLICDTLKWSHGQNSVLSAKKSLIKACRWTIGLTTDLDAQQQKVRKKQGISFVVHNEIVRYWRFRLLRFASRNGLVGLHQVASFAVIAGLY